MKRKPDHLDEQQNTSLASGVMARLRRGRRLAHDTYYRAFLEQRGLGRVLASADCTLHERRYVRGDRLYLLLEYRDRGGIDHVAWHLYLPIEADEQLARHALKCLLACLPLQSQRANYRNSSHLLPSSQVSASASRAE